MNGFMKFVVIDGKYPDMSHEVARFYRQNITQLLQQDAEKIKEALSFEYSVILFELISCAADCAARVCECVRSAEVVTPILVLADEDDVLSRVTLLDAGADDYLLKTCHKDELRARVAALLRRSRRRYVNRIITVGGLTLDVTKRAVYRNGLKLSLRRKEYDILECLVLNRGRVMTRENILDYAWGFDSDRWNNTVDVHIKYLRDKIERPFGEKVIQTVHGTGYMIAEERLN